LFFYPLHNLIQSKIIKKQIKIEIIHISFNKTRMKEKFLIFLLTHIFITIKMNQSVKAKIVDISAFSTENIIIII